jgi:hypothetical protein
MARRVVVLHIALILMTSVVVTAVMVSRNTEGASPAPYRLAAYEWRGAGLLTSDQIVQQLQELRAEGFRTIYLNVTEYADVFELADGNERQKLLEAFFANVQRYCRIASSLDIEVHALAGDERWSEPSHRYLTSALIGFVEDYNSTAGSVDERLSGLQFDIEPYSRPDFAESQQRLMTEYLATVQLIVEEFRRRQTMRGLRLGLTVPFWLDGDNGHARRMSYRGAAKFPTFHVIDLLSALEGAYLILMDYRDYASGPDGAIEHARGEFSYASQVQSSLEIVVGQEFTDVQPAKITHHGQSRARFRGELTKLADAFGASRSFGGFSVNDVEAYVSSR